MRAEKEAMVGEERPEEEVREENNRMVGIETKKE